MTSAKKHPLRALLLASAASGVLAMASYPAFAQDNDEDEAAASGETILVTGSRIARTDFTAESPITVVTGEEIQASGLQDLGEVLRQQLSASSGGFSQTSTLSGAGATSVDLRKLGAIRVLVLINGRRIARFTDTLANETTDLSSIPVAMVQRVEILRDGASATYGADAITGVINIITKSDYQGLEVSVQQGVSTHGDGESTQVSAVMGGNFDRGNVVAGLEYRFFDKIPQRERSWAIPTITGLNNNGLRIGSPFHPGGMFSGAVFRCYHWEGNVDLGFTPQCPGYGGFLPIGAFTTIEDAAEHGWDYALVQNLFNQQKILGASFFGTYDITGNVQAFMEMQYSKRQSIVILDGNPGSVAAPNYHPDAQGPGGVGFGSYFIRPTTTVGERRGDIESDTVRIVAGLTGTLFDNWNWELSYLYARTTSTALTQGQFNAVRLAKILDPVACWADAQCSNVLIEAGRINVGVDALPFATTQWTQGEIDYIAQTAQSMSKFQMSGVQAVVSGDLLQLPAGALGVAVGYEYREEKGLNQPDSMTIAGESVANQVFRTEGSFDTHEVFAEVNLPLLKDAPLAQELSVNLQGRWFEYSNFGSDTVWKAGLNWQLWDDLRIRATYGKAFRAPTVTNLFGGGTESFDFWTDPCSASFVGSARWNALSAAEQANVTANCTTHLSQYPSAPAYGAYQQLAAQIRILAGANPDLEPETSDSWTVGAVFTPGFLPNLAVAVDYWNIEVTNLISRPTTQVVAEDCYKEPRAAGDFGNVPDCHWDRNPITGEPVGVVNRLTNFGDDVLRTDGVDWGVNYFFDMFGGVMSLDHGHTWTMQYNTTPRVGQTSGNAGSTPRHRGFVSGTFMRDNWMASWRMRYIGSMFDPNMVVPNVLGLSNTTGFHHEHDIRLGYEWDNVSLLFGVNNVFDQNPPQIFSTGTNADPFLFTSAALGRYFFGRVTARF